jgi:RNA polymerase sigma factor (sigma-70 family)
VSSTGQVGVNQTRKRSLSVSRQRQDQVRYFVEDSNTLIRKTLFGFEGERQSWYEMNTVTTPTDRDLVRSYAREGSETAFRALVSRHVDLVFATAYRQVGDRGLAEEITQNVFVRLARKSTVLAGHETIVGWLHRCAILESKACFRAEMRRRRREEIAAALAETQSTGRDLTLDLSPLLDEALLQLRDGDRVALVLRFLEERSFREVGTALGVDENAARQRVNRALSKVTEFFRQQGVVLPAAGGAAVLHQSTLAAPVGLASTASAAGLAVGGPASGLGVVLLSIMNLTPTKTAMLCGALVLLPIGWQFFTVGRAEREVESLRRELARFNDQLTGTERELADLDRALLQLRNETAAQRAEVARIKDAIPKANSDFTPAGLYRWDDKAPVVRLPKRLLAGIWMTGNTNSQGELSPEIRAILQLSDDETRKVQSAIDRFTAEYQQLILKVARPVPSTPEELGGRSRDEVKTFEFFGLNKPALGLRLDYLTELKATLDTERLRLLDRYGAFSGETDHRLTVYQFDPSPPNAAEPVVTFRVEFPDRGLSTTQLPLRDFPRYARPLIQSWLDAVDQRTRVSAPATSAPTNP